jgi:hypothetical protein
MMPELVDLSKEVPIEFIEADSMEGRRQLGRTGLPQVVLPIVNVDNKTLLMGYHHNVRGKILKSLMNSSGVNRAFPEKVIVEKEWRENDQVCIQDIEFNLKNGNKIEKNKKCWVEY